LYLQAARASAAAAAVDALHSVLHAGGRRRNSTAEAGLGDGVGEANQSNQI
jgi:hypothetical protein